MKEQNGLPHVIAQAKRGDQEAFASIYSRFSQGIYFHALKILQDDGDARDVLQEVMMNLYKSLGSIKSPKMLQVYLHRATYHTALNLIKKRGDWSSGNELESILDSVTETSLEFIPESYAENQERRAYMVGLIENLSPVMKTVVLLYYYDGLSVKEIAQVLDANVETVKNRLHRARETLREKMEYDMKNEKKNALNAVSIPVLTRILRYEAEAAFTPDVSNMVWQDIAKGLGFSVATATAASVVAAPAAVTSFSATKIIAALLAVGGIAATAVVLIDDIATPLSDGDSTQLHISSSQSVEVDIDSPNSPNRDVLTSGENFFPEPDAVPHTPQDSVEPPISAEYSGNLYQGESDILFIANTHLTYPLGTVLTRERLLADAGVSLLVTDMDMQQIELYGLELIDVSRPNNYAVILLVPSEEEEPLRGVLAISITN